MGIVSRIESEHKTSEMKRVTIRKVRSVAYNMTKLYIQNIIETYKYRPFLSFAKMLPENPTTAVYILVE